MRPLLLLSPLLLLLLGCPASPSSSDASKAATPSPTPATPVKAVGVSPVYTGVWTTVDDQGQVFDLLVFPNGQTVTTSTKGKAGAQGQHGFWRKEGTRLLAFFDDGSSSILAPDPTGLRYQGFPPDMALDATPGTSAPLNSVPDPASKFVGVWQLNKEPDGDYLYIALQSNGRAFSTVNGGTEGKWVAKDDGAECTWPDGWVDRIERSNQGWQKRSWIGTSSDSPADLSPAIRLGEARFSTAPQATP